MSFALGVHGRELVRYPPELAAEIAGQGYFSLVPAGCGRVLPYAVELSQSIEILRAYALAAPAHALLGRAELFLAVAEQAGALLLGLGNGGGGLLFGLGYDGGGLLFGLGYDALGLLARLGDELLGDRLCRQDGLAYLFAAAGERVDTLFLSGVVLHKTGIFLGVAGALRAQRLFFLGQRRHPGRERLLFRLKGGELPAQGLVLAAELRRNAAELLYRLLHLCGGVIFVSHELQPKTLEILSAKRHFSALSRPRAPLSSGAALFLCALYQISAL